MDSGRITRVGLTKTNSRLSEEMRQGEMRQERELFCVHYQRGLSGHVSAITVALRVVLEYGWSSLTDEATIRLHVEPLEEGGFVATSPDVPGRRGAR